MIRPFVFLFSFIIIQCHAQFIQLKPIEVNLGVINFDQEYIKCNRIKAITLNIVDKPDGSVIIDKNATQGFEFDSLGRTTRYYYTILNKLENKEIHIPAIVKRGKVIQPSSVELQTIYTNDTIFVSVFYDQLNRVISKRVKTGDFYDAYYYEYNNEQRLSKEIHFKETNSSENKKEFKLGVQTLLSSEKFEYKRLSPTQIRKSCLNDEGREYKKGILNYDERGNKISENYEFIVNWMRSENLYKYDSINRVTELTVTNNISGEQTSVSKFLYNNNKLVTEQRYNKEGQLINEISYLYDSNNNKLVKSQLNRDFKNTSIRITKYSYTFF